MVVYFCEKKYVGNEELEKYYCLMWFGINENYKFRFVCSVMLM